VKRLAKRLRIKFLKLLRLKAKFFKTCIQRNAKFKELAQGQKTIFDVTKASDKGNKNYRELALEVMSRLGMKAKTVKMPMKAKSKRNEMSVGGVQ